MKTFRLTMATLAVSLLAFLGCSKSDLTKPQNAANTSSYDHTVVDDICGEPKTYNLVTCNGVILGSLTISNDEENLFVKFTTTTDLKLSKSYLVIGDLAHVTAATDCTAWPKIGAGPNPADYKKTHKPEVTEYTYTVPLANLGECFYINAFAKLIKRDAYNNVVAHDFVLIQSADKVCKKWSTYIQYCVQECPPECGPLTTYTQGGYGNDQGNGAGTEYMIANFDAAFPNGVTVGCATGFTMVMNSAAAVQAYLPSGSTAEALTQNWVDDGPETVLGGQLLTLALSIGFDLNDPNFGAGSQHLEDMVIASGDFAGMTVAQFFAIANDVFGGCSTDYTPQQINDVADAINNNYDNGTEDDGFLDCPDN